MLTFLQQNTKSELEEDDELSRIEAKKVVEIVPAKVRV